MLARNAVIEPDGLFHLNGAGANRVVSSSYPTIARLFVIAFLAFDPGEEGAHAAAITCYDDDGKVVSSVPGLHAEIKDSMQAWRLSILVDFLIPRPGNYRIEFRVDGKSLGWLSLLAAAAENAVPS